VRGLPKATVIVALVLGAVTLTARAAAPPLSLVWIDPDGAATGLESLARAEAVNLLREMGVAASWRIGHAGGPLCCAGEIQFIFLDRTVERQPNTHVLGATRVLAEGFRVVWIHVAGVQSALGFGRRPAPARPLDETRALAIAVGRIVAHEAVHALAPSVRHGTGLMAPVLRPRQLTALSITIEPEVRLAVQAAVRGEASLLHPEAGVVAATSSGDAQSR
jgi:hypothetical protein